MARKQENKEEVKEELTEVFPEDKEPKVKEAPKRKFNGYVHIDTFLSTAKALFNLPESQVAGFRAYMAGRSYLYDEKDFLPYLEKYLGKELKIN